MLTARPFVYHAGPINYTLESSDKYTLLFTYRRTRGNHTAIATIYIERSEHGQQLLDIWNAYAKQSGSNWEYTSA